MLEINQAGCTIGAFQLKNIDITLAPGRVMGLIGQNGAGKTTLIRLILNMIDRSQGTIHILGRDNILEETRVKAEMGMVFDHNIFYREWTAVTVGKVMESFFAKWSPETYQRLLKQFQLPLDVKVSKLSRGMQMKLMLAAALPHEARLLILDEPTSGLNPAVRDEILWLLKGFVQNGENSVLFSTHITSDLEKIADDIAYLRRGKIHYAGTKEAFQDKYYTVAVAQNELAKSTFTGKIIGPRTEDGVVRGIVARGRTSGLRRETLSPATLEEIMVCLERKDASHG